MEESHAHRCTVAGWDLGVFELRNLINPSTGQCGTRMTVYVLGNVAQWLKPYVS